MLTKRSLVILAGVLMIIALMVLISWSPATVMAQGPAPTPAPPVAVLKVLAIPGNAADPNAITTTVKYITDTAVGEAKAVAAMYTKGGSNVPLNVPVVLEVSAADSKNSGKPTWSLTKPADSKATITGTMTAKDGKFITHEVVSGSEQGITEVRGTTEIKADGSFQVSTEYLKDGQWVPGREVTYKEEASAKVEFK